MLQLSARPVRKPPVAGVRGRGQEATALGPAQQPAGCGSEHRSVVRRIDADLPVFRMEDGDRAILYTPGHATVVSAVEADSVERALASYVRDGRAGRLAAALRVLATRALNAYHTLAERPFEPECLTLYLSNVCNLGCTYCYSTDRTRGNERTRGPRALPVLAAGAARQAARPVHESAILDPGVAAAAARVVAAACARKRKAMTVVFHGGGEPTVHWSLLQQLVAITRQIAADHGVRWWGYIATNGVFGEEKARWLAQAFDLRGLSCDGPPDIQDTQRRAVNGRATSTAIERTSRVWREMGAAFTVRATITPATVRRQAEVCSYLAERLRAREIVLEPVYRPGSLEQERFRPEDADLFVEHYLEAERVARRLGCRIRISGVRPDQVHGPFCNVLRDVLQVTPDGVATACFLCTGSDARDASLAVGRAIGTEFLIDLERIRTMRRAATRIPDRCQQCANMLHCARDCPDVCPVLDGAAADGGPGGFRCRVQKRLGETWIRRAARSESASGIEYNM